MWVTIGSGEGKGLSIKVEGERFLVGTGAECQLKLADPKAAPLHAYFEVGEGGNVVLHELGSETLVDGERLDGSRVIEGGEEIRVGETLLVPSLDDPAEVEPPEEPPAVVLTTQEGQKIEVVPAGAAPPRGARGGRRAGP